MADFIKVSQQYVRVLKTADRVAKKHGEKAGELSDDVIQNINMIQLHAKKAKKPIMVDPKVLARFSVKAKRSQEKLRKFLDANVRVQPQRIKPVFIEFEEHVRDFIRAAGVNDPGEGDDSGRPPGKRNIAVITNIGVNDWGEGDNSGKGGKGGKG